MKKSHFGTAVMSLAFAGAAVAQNATPSQSDAASGNKAQGTTNQFSSVDLNGDGRISQAEARSHTGNLGTSFGMLDADKDTYLSQSEFGKWNSGAGQGGKMPSDSGRAPQDGAPHPQDGTSPPGRSPSQPGNGSPQSSSGDSSARQPGSDSGDRTTR